MIMLTEESFTASFSNLDSKFVTALLCTMAPIKQAACWLRNAEIFHPFCLPFSLFSFFLLKHIYCHVSEVQRRIEMDNCIWKPFIQRSQIAEQNFKHKNGTVLHLLDSFYYSKQYSVFNTRNFGTKEKKKRRYT